MPRPRPFLHEHCGTGQSQHPHTHQAVSSLSVNTENTKIVVFRYTAKVSSKEKWVYNNESIEVVDCFNYLGLTIYFNGKFFKNLEDICISR